MCDSFVDVIHPFRFSQQKKMEKGLAGQSLYFLEEKWGSKQQNRKKVIGMKRKTALFLAVLLMVMEILNIANLYGVMEVKAAETLAKVYWNPTDSHIVEVDGAVISSKGDDTNTGKNKSVPVRTWERARELVADGGTIYVLSPCDSQELPVVDGVHELNGGDKDIVLQSLYTSGEKEILDGAKTDNLRLENITLFPAEEGGSVVVLQQGAKLVFGNSVSIYNKGQIYLQGEVSDRIKVEGNTLSGQNFYLTYEELPKEEGDIVARVQESVTEGEKYFQITFQKKEEKEWFVEQRETGVVSFYEKVVYGDRIYVCDKGWNTNSGHSKEKAVKTIERAIALMEKELGGKGTICICGSFTITGEEVWDYGKEVTFLLEAESGEDDLIIEETGSLSIKSGTLKNESQKGTKADKTTAANIFSNGKVEIESGVLAENISVNTTQGTFVAKSGDYTTITNKGATLTLAEITANQVVNTSGTITIDGGTYNITGDVVIQNKGTLVVNAGAFSGNKAVIVNTGTLTWNNGSIETTGNDYAVQINDGTLYLRKGKIIGSNAVKYTKGTLKLDGFAVEIPGRIYAQNEITMTDSTISNCYQIEINDTKFTLGSTVVSNLGSREEAEKFTVISNEYISTYSKSDKGIVLCPKDSYYVDPENGDDSKAGNLPEMAWRSIEKAMVNVPQDRDITIYVMESIKPEGNMTVTYGGTGSVTIKAYKNMTTSFFSQEIEGVTLTLQNITLDGSNPVWGQKTYERKESVCVVNAGSFLLEDVIVTGSDVNTNGGGILQQGGSVTIRGRSGLEKNHGKNGGAIYVAGGSLSVSETVSISGNTASENGGAFYLSQKEHDMVKIAGTIAENSATNGAGIYVATGTVILSTSTVVDGNEAAKNGGGIYLEDGTAISEGVIRNNTVKGKAAAVYVGKDSVFATEGGTITSNGRDASSVEEENKKKTSNDIYVEGELQILGATTLDDVIYQAKGAKTIKIKGSGADTQKCIIGYHSALEGAAIVEYASENNAKNGINYLLERDYQEETDEAARPNLEVRGVYVIISSDNVYLKSVWEEKERQEVEAEGKMTASTFAEACEKLKAKGKGNIVICGQVKITEEENWDLEEQGITWNPEVRFSDACFDSCGNKCSDSCQKLHSIYVSTNGKLNLKNITINGNGVEVTGCIYVDGGSVNMYTNTVIYNGGKRGIYVKSGKVCITGGEIRECLDGGIYNSSAGTLNVTATEGEAISFCDNEVTCSGWSTGGAAIWNKGTCLLVCEGTGQIVLSNNVVYDGTSWCGGGAIWNEGICQIETLSEKGRIKFVNNIYYVGTNNSSNTGGGAIHNAKTLLITGKEENNEKTISMENNQMQGEGAGNVGGGAIKNRGGDKLILEHVEFRENQVNGKNLCGGGLEIWGDEVEISNCTFFENTSSNRGGAIEFRNAPMVVKDCYFKGNQAASPGGGISYFQKTDLEKKLEDCVFEGNVATQDGGGIYILNTQRDEAITTVENCQFVNNASGKSGGGGYFGEGVIIRNSRFEKNTASSSGGGAGALAAAMVENTEFVKNIAKGKGGGASFNKSTDIKNSSFCENAAGSNNANDAGGGGLYFGGKTNICDSSIKNNTAKRVGGGIYNAGSNCVISNCEILENMAWNEEATNGREAQGGGIWNSGTVRMEDCHNNENRCYTDSTTACTAYAMAGGIYNKGTFVMKNSTNNENCADSAINNVYAAGIYNSGTFTMENSESNENTMVGNAGITGSITCTGNAAFTMKNSSCNKNAGNGVFASNGGTIYLQENSSIAENEKHGVYSGYGGKCQIIMEEGNQIVRNQASGVAFWPNDALFVMNGGTISENGAYGVDMANRVTLYMNGGTISKNGNYGINMPKNSMSTGTVLLNGGIIEENTSYGVYLGDGTLKLYAGNIEISDTIYMDSKGDVIQLQDVRTTATNQYNIMVSNAFSMGDTIVEPVDTVKDAGLYQHFFQVLRTGAGLEASEEKLILSQVYFIGASGKEVVDTDTLGATPRNPYTSWEELKAAIGDKAATIYVCGTVEITQDNTVGTDNLWSLAENQNIYRYTGADIAGESYEKYSFLEEPLFVVKSGGKAAFTDIHILGNKFLEQKTDCGETASLITVESGGELKLGENVVIGNTATSDKCGYVNAINQNGGTLFFAENATVYGIVALNEYTDDNGKIQMSYIHADATFGEKLTLRLASWKEGQMCVAYGNADVTKEQAAKITAQYEVDGQVCSLVFNMLNAQEKKIEIAKKGVFYVDGSRSVDQWNEEDGSTPETAFHSMEQVYDKIKEQEGGSGASTAVEYVVYIAGAVKLDKTVSYFSNQGYGSSANNLVTEIKDTITVKRYSKPEGHSDWKESYTGALFQIAETEVIFDNLIIDGHSKAAETTENGEAVVERQAVENTEPLITTKEGTRLTLQGVSVLRNNAGDMVSAAGELYLKDNGKIGGVVDLTGTANCIKAETGYLPAEILDIKVSKGEYENRVVVDYDDTESVTEKIQAQRLQQYALTGTAEEGYRLVTQVTESTDTSQIFLKKKGAIYLDPVSGDDANVENCETPSTAVKTLEKAYEAAKSRIGNCNVYIMNTVVIENTVSMTENKYHCGTSNISLSNSSVSFWRYVNTENTEAVSTFKNLTEALFKVGEETGNKTELTISNLVMDGSKTTENSEETISTNVNTTKALIDVTENASVVIDNGTVLRNNQSVYVPLQNEAVGNIETTEENYLGGAIYNKGTVILNGGTITGNETVIAKGGIDGKNLVYAASIMQGGSLTISGTVNISGQEIFLAEGKKIDSMDNLSQTDTLLLRMEEYINKREVVEFESSACITDTENGKKIVVPEVLAKISLPSEVQEKVYVTQSTMKENAAMLRQKVAVSKEPEDILGNLTETGEIRTTTIKLEDKTNMEEIHTELWYCKEEERKRVVFEESTLETDVYIISGGSVTSNIEKSSYKVDIPIRKETIGTYYFQLYLDDKLAVETEFVVSAYQWTDEAGNALKKIKAETGLAAQSLEETTAYYTIYNGYARQMYSWIGGTSIEGIGDYKPKLVKKDTLKKLSEEEANTSFAVEIVSQNASAKVAGLNVSKALLKQGKETLLCIPAKGKATYAVTIFSHSGLNVNEEANLYLEKVTLGKTEQEAMVTESNVTLGIVTKTQYATVLVKQNEEAVTGAGISFQRQDGTIITLQEKAVGEGENGCYVGNIPAGRYTLLLSMGGSTYKKEVSVKNDEKKSIELECYTVTFEKGAEEAQVSNGAKVIIAEKNGIISLPDSSQKMFLWDGYKVSGWKLQGEEERTFLAGSLYTVDKKTVLSAVWEALPTAAPIPIPTKGTLEVTATPVWATITPEIIPTSTVSATAIPGSKPTELVSATTTPNRKPMESVSATTKPNSKPTESVNATTTPNIVPTAIVDATTTPDIEPTKPVSATAIPGITPTEPAIGTAVPSITPTVAITPTVIPTERVKQTATPIPSIAETEKATNMPTPKTTLTPKTTPKPTASATIQETSSVTTTSTSIPTKTPDIAQIQQSGNITPPDDLEHVADEEASEKGMLEENEIVGNSEKIILQPLWWIWLFLLLILIKKYTEEKKDKTETK